MCSFREALIAWAVMRQPHLDSRSSPVRLPILTVDLPPKLWVLYFLRAPEDTSCSLNYHTTLHV